MGQNRHLKCQIKKTHKVIHKKFPANKKIARRKKTGGRFLYDPQNQVESRPISRVLCTAGRTRLRGSHSSRRIVAEALKQPTRKRRASHAMLPYLVLLRMGFTVPPGVDPGRGELLPHPFTLT